jgi:hypothetical protein
MLRRARIRQEVIDPGIVGLLWQAGPLEGRLEPFVQPQRSPLDLLEWQGAVANVQQLVAVLSHVDNALAISGPWLGDAAAHSR